jgi:hypothetical protein
MSDLPPPPAVAGTSLDGTEPYVITAEQNAALCRSTGVQPATDGTAHPIYYYRLRWAKQLPASAPPATST